jgi:hypothetical protein
MGDKKEPSEINGFANGSKLIQSTSENSLLQLILPASFSSSPKTKLQKKTVESPTSLTSLPQLSPRSNNRKGDVVLDIRMTKSANKSPAKDYGPSVFQRQFSAPLADNAQAYTGLIADTKLKTVTTWPRRYVNDPTVIELAEGIVDRIKKLTSDCIIEGQDTPSALWSEHANVLDFILDTSSKLDQRKKISLLCDATIKNLNSQPSIVKVKAPCKVFGDVHGQLRDLLLLLSKYGFPHHRDGDVDLTRYINI